MCYKLLQPYPLSRQTHEFGLTLLADLIIKQLDEQPGRRKKRRANWWGASYPTQIPAFGKKYASFDVAEASPGLGVCS